MTAHMESLRILAERQSKSEIKLTYVFVADKQFVRFGSIGKSIGGMHIPIIKISNATETGRFKQKPVVMIIGR